MRCVLACCGGKVIVQTSEFCDGEKLASIYLEPLSQPAGFGQVEIWMLFKEWSKNTETVKIFVNECNIC